MIKYKYEKNKRVSTQKVNERKRGLMKKNHFIQLITTGIIIVTAASGCNKSTASVPDASSVEAASTIETNTIETVSTAETSGENLVSTEATSSKSDASKSGTSETEKSKTDATNKNTESDSTKASDKTEPATTKAAGASTTEAATGTEESTSKAIVTETTTQAAATAPTTAHNKKQEETTTQAPTEKATEKQTEKTTEKATQAPTKPAHTHSYTSAVTKASTCTSEGVMTFTCSCGDSYTKAISKTAHNYGSYTYNNDATYESDGTETAVCSVCGDRTTRTAGGTKLVHVHSYSESVTTAPSCTAEGVKTFACSCGSSYTEAIPATGHAWSDYAYNNDATTESDGTKTRYCTVCGERETVTAEGTRKNLPSWYDEHSQPLNTTTGSQDDGSLEAYFVSGQFSWSDAALGCWDFGYSMTSDYVGTYAEGNVYHGYLYE